MSDSVPLDKISADPPASSADTRPRFDWRLSMFMLVLYLVINSSMFIENVLTGLGTNMARDSVCTTNTGTVVQGLIFVLIYSITQLLVDKRVL